ncbi:MAG: transcriptional regulator [Thiocapsa sp.]|uniref:HVO_A0114 family putative DNA-binding protein n=1 Tax=Thiocapsa sp. TaxID=2024551 RepID=UPI001BCC36AC|nr:transcriptional regulator [Thiocapsa sp.]QVL49977.1 MAG: transcriptional regulator [Thiocapsa sp.]
MNRLMIRVEAEDEWSRRIVQAVERGKPQPPGYSFTTEEDLLDTLTANRFAILKALTGAGPLGVRELARRVGRDVRAVHADAGRLASIGLIDKTSDGKLHFPYDEVRIEMAWHAAA